MDKPLYYMLDNLNTLYKCSNVYQVAADENCRVLKVTGSDGEGFMTLYQVFQGVYLMYDDFHMKFCASDYQAADTLLCIDHCREGRIEHESGHGIRYCMEPGDVRIDRRVHHKGMVHMPLCHYHGITVGFQTDLAEIAMKKELPAFDIDIRGLAEKFCPDDRECLIRDDEGLNRVFMQLYNVNERLGIDYFRLKVIELLMCLKALSPEDFSIDRQYFSAAQAEKVKVVHDLITAHPERNYTIDELSKICGLPSATMRRCFKGMYGSPVYQFIKGYRMQYAADLLLSDRERHIADIAQSVGYDNASKFSAAFRGVMGVTPQKYRKGGE
ncbi:AraC family transcriptional regulator [Ruminococcus flavefaciens]|uniref:helix-turn-helix domain-containing protein n=1 Tax=Ruminococcus flavefaciens TaxID=1265 RepID=UPI0026EFC787|nr:AraC family transcriptional regulator [Ruminococcus flavefaciens]